MYDVLLLPTNNILVFITIIIFVHQFTFSSKINYEKGSKILFKAQYYVNKFKKKCKVKNIIKIISITYIIQFPLQELLLRQ